MPSFSSHYLASDGMLAVCRFARGRQKAVAHNAPTIASNSFENRCSICNLLTAEPQRRLTSMENHSGPRRINPVLAHVEHCARRGVGLGRSAQVGGLSQTGAQLNSGIQQRRYCLVPLLWHS